MGTTLRTEIYTSEDEEEMINYHAVISDYKKSFKEKLAGATSEDYQMHHEFQGRPKVVHARDPEQFNMKENRNDKKGEIGGET